MRETPTLSQSGVRKCLTNGRGSLQVVEVVYL